MKPDREIIDHIDQIVWQRWRGQTEADRRLELDLFVNGLTGPNSPEVLRAIAQAKVSLGTP